MDPMASDSTGDETNILQSIRSSCDRCRFHKLRCFRSTSSVSVPTDRSRAVFCERCTRAQVPCVFGRRRRACTKKRQSCSSTASNSTSTKTIATAADSDENSEAYNQSQTTFPPQSHLSTLSPSSPTLTFPHATLPVQSWDNENFMLGLHDRADSHSDQQNALSLWGSMQQEFNLNDAFMLGADLLEPSWFTAAVLEDQCIDTATTTNSTNATVPGERVVNVIAKMQQCLQILEQGPWQNDSTNHLDDYPVGTVLHLSQEFGSIASQVLNRGCTVGTITPREYISASESPTEEAKPMNFEGGSDTVTTLLMLSGYMSLARIYSLVLGQFQTHLSSVASNSNTDHSSGVHNASTNPTLKLGELPCTSAAPVLRKIHTALRMLLTALHGVEDKLGPGGAVARNLVVAVLAQEAVIGAGEFHGGLSRKIQSMKELLQEKMNM